MYNKSESLLGIFLKGMAFLLLAFIIAYCLVAILAGDGDMGLINLLYGY